MPRARAETNGSAPVRVATAKATPDAEIVRAPPRESAIDSAAELKPRSESPESASIATLVRG